MNTTKAVKPTIKPYGVHAVVLVWVSHTDIAVDVLNWYRFLEINYTEKLVDLTMGYSNIVLFLKTGVDQNELIEDLKTLNATTNLSKPKKTNCLEVPVYYDLENKWDLQYVAEKNQLTAEEVIEKHIEVTYPIRFFGFLPGFVYLDGLNTQLATPRKTTPRKAIPAGAVGIGGSQTGIYPQKSPGGWQIIGETPIQLFNAKQTPPVFLNSGDYIRFKAVNKATFITIQKQVERENYDLNQLLIQ